jgi:hypothetical protein
LPKKRAIFIAQKRSDSGFRRPGLPALRDARDERRAGGDHRPGLSLYADCQSRYFVPEWSFGIREPRLQKTVDEVRAKGAQAVVLLSHNGMDIDLKLAGRVRGIDAILGGHTHDGVPRPPSSAKTLVPTRDRTENF